MQTMENVKLADAEVNTPEFPRAQGTRWGAATQEPTEIAIRALADVHESSDSDEPAESKSSGPYDTIMLYNM